MGFLVLLIVTLGATALAVGAATGILLLLLHLMRTTVLDSPIGRHPTLVKAAAVKKRDATTVA